MCYTILRAFFLLFFKICFRLKIFGRETFPLEGSMIVASNHVSFLDPIVVAVGAPRKLIFLARDTLFKFRPFGRALNLINTFSVKQEGGDIGAFKLALNKLSQGDLVVIFPEGTRSEDGNLQKPKHGIGFIQAASGASILPCYVKGSREALPRHSFFPRFNQISIYFGKPLKFDKDLFKEHKKIRHRYVAKQVMAAIAELKENAN
ncbi:lysophospholipid acyltransferase family protein [Candidatus Omnitrophota bacterium]